MKGENVMKVNLSLIYQQTEFHDILIIVQGDGSQSSLFIIIIIIIVIRLKECTDRKSFV